MNALGWCKKHGASLLGAGKDGQHLLAAERERAAWRDVGRWFLTQRHAARLPLPRLAAAAWLSCDCDKLPGAAGAPPNCAASCVGTAYCRLPQPMVQGLLGRGINTKSEERGALGEHGLASAVKEACVAALKDVRGLLAAQ